MVQQPNIQIVIDTREQLQLPFSNYILKKLDVGDYSIVGYENKIAIERKTINDLFGTLTGGMKRFKEEINRAQSLEYFAIVVIARAMDVAQGIKHSDRNGISILRTLFTIHFKYNVKVFFCYDEVEAVLLINLLFEAYLKRKEAEKDEKVRT